MSPSVHIHPRCFGSLPDGRAVHAYNLHTATGHEVEILNYGGIIARWLVPARNGERADIVLGFKDLAGYLGDHPYFGVIVGRVAGRIPGGKLRLGGKTFELPLNHPPNHLHGGPDALDKKLWTAEARHNADASASVLLRYHSPDGEGGYPGAVDLTATYTLHPDGTFDFATEAVSHQFATPISLTQHSYFHLGGEGSASAEAHTLRIPARQFIPIDEAFTPLGVLESVEHTPSDLLTPRAVGDFAPQVWLHHGALYWLGTAPHLKFAARLEDPASGRAMEVQTTHSCLQTYLAPAFDGTIIGKSGRAYPRFGAVCLECEGYPDATNTPGFGSILVPPGQPQRQLTRYTFPHAS